MRQVEMELPVVEGIVERLDFEPLSETQRSRKSPVGASKLTVERSVRRTFRISRLIRHQMAVSSARVVPILLLFVTVHFPLSTRRREDVSYVGAPLVGIFLSADDRPLGSYTISLKRRELRII